MQDMLKNGDKAEKMCSRECKQIKRCGGFIPADVGVKVTILRIHPTIQRCYEVLDPEFRSTICPRENLEKIEKWKPYWGQSQSEPTKPTAKPIEEVKPVEPVTPVPVAGVEDFGYGPACSFPKCHAMKNEDHSVKCPKDGQFDPEVIL